MMQQYMKFKQDPKFKDHIIFFQMGEFYEMFFDDAVKASETLGITLTRRGNHLGEPIPMCGVPVFARDTYLARLIAAGHKVVICDQTESRDEARHRAGVTSIVKREVTRIVTSGTVTEDALLAPSQHNYLTSISVAPDGTNVGLVWLDLSTGWFYVSPCRVEDVSAELARMPPAELLVPQKLLQGPSEALITSLTTGLEGCTITACDDAQFTADAGTLQLQSALWSEEDMAAADGLRREELAAVGGLLSYVAWTQRGELPRLFLRRKLPSSEAGVSFMQLDPSTRKSLELTRPFSGRRRARGCLLREVDYTCTPLGGRLIGDRISQPLNDVQAIENRLDAVEWLSNREPLRQVLRTKLQDCPDMERCLQRVNVRRAAPRDLGALRDGLAAVSVLGLALATGDHVSAPKVTDELRAAALERPCQITPDQLSKLLRTAQMDFDAVGDSAGAAAVLQAACGSTNVTTDITSTMLRNIAATLLLHWVRVPNPTAADDTSDLADAFDKLKAALVESPSANLSDGGFIRPGHCERLDRYRELRDHSKTAVEALVSKYREITGIPNMKVAHTVEAGYSVEVTNKFVDKMLPHPQFKHSKTLKSSVRFTTAELADIDNQVARASAQAIAREIEIFEELCDVVRAAAQGFASVARAVAVLDVSCGLAALAGERGFCRPRVHDGTELEIVGGRHAVVESSLLSGMFAAGDEATAKMPRAFVTNSMHLAAPGAQRAWLITGPNMGGKSTFLRQTAHIILLAQMGSFVPATKADIGVVDCLFSRVGAADDLSRNRSTFMCEMEETANILRNATSKSFVIVDEVGRGTSTADGLAIAWAVLEDLCLRVGCRTLFATHFHELSALADVLEEAAAADTPIAAALKCMTMGVHETESGPALTYKVVPGVANKSYGLHVGKMAGLPAHVLSRAATIVDRLDREAARVEARAFVDKLVLDSQTTAAAACCSGIAVANAASGSAAGWKMTDRFVGLRFEITLVADAPATVQAVVSKADEYAGFGWVQVTPGGNVVGEFRGNKRTGALFKDWMHTGAIPGVTPGGKIMVMEYKDTKIRFHFSHFKVLPTERPTCFPEPPHACADAQPAAVNAAAQPAAVAAEQASRLEL